MTGNKSGSRWSLFLKAESVAGKADVHVAVSVALVSGVCRNSPGRVARSRQRRLLRGQGMSAALQGE